MIILGKTACGDSDSMMATATNIEDINMIQLSGGMFDEFFVTTRVYTTWDGSIPDEWDFDTKIHALFQESLLGGNVEFTAESVSSILVRSPGVAIIIGKRFLRFPSIPMRILILCATTSTTGRRRNTSTASCPP